MPTPCEIKSPYTLSVCFLTESPSDEQAYDFAPLQQIADQMVIGIHQPHPSFTEAAPQEAVEFLEFPEEEPDHIVLNKLIENIRTDWVLILTSSEKICPPDISRLAYLLTHPIKPCYEMPLRHYSPTPFPQGKAREELYSELGKDFSFYLETFPLKLFRKDAGIFFDGASDRLSLREDSSLRCPPFRCFVPVHRLSPLKERRAGYNEGKFRIRIETVRTLQDPDNWRAQQSLGMTYLEQRDPINGCAPLERANQLRPDNILLLNALGYAYMELGRHEEALQVWQQALRINPQFHMALSNIAVLHMRSQKFEAAINILRRVLQIQPDDPHSHYNLASCYMTVGQTDQAIPHYRAAVNYDPKYLAPAADLGAVLMEKGNFAEAEPLLRRVLEREPSHQIALFNLGRLYMKLERKEEGLELWKRLVKLYPSNPLSKKLQEQVPALRAIGES